MALRILHCFPTNHYFFPSVPCYSLCPFPVSSTCLFICLPHSRFCTPPFHLPLRAPPARTARRRIPFTPPRRLPITWMELGAARKYLCSYRDGTWRFASCGGRATDTRPGRCLASRRGRLRGAPCYQATGGGAAAAWRWVGQRINILHACLRGIDKDGMTARLSRQSLPIPPPTIPFQPSPPPPSSQTTGDRRQDVCCFLAKLAEQKASSLLVRFRGGTEGSSSLNFGDRQAGTDAQCAISCVTFPASAPSAFAHSPTLPCPGLFFYTCTRLAWQQAGQAARTQHPSWFTFPRALPNKHA